MPLNIKNSSPEELLNDVPTLNRWAIKMETRLDATHSTATQSASVANTIAQTSSVGLAMPNTFAVTGSPVRTTGTLKAAWVPQVPKTFLGVPYADAVAAVTNASTTSALSITTTVQDLVFYFAKAEFHGSALSAVSGTGWNVLNVSAAEESYYGVFPAGTITQVASYTTSNPGYQNLSQALIAFPTFGSPVVTTLATGGGAFGRLGITGTVVSGMGLLAVLMTGQIFNGAFVGAGSVSDTQGNVWYKISESYNFFTEQPDNATSGTGIATWYCPNPVVGATTFTFTFANGVSCASANAYVYSITNLAPVASTPGFRYIAAGDITGGVIATSNGGTGADLAQTGGTGQVLRQETLGGGITVSKLDYSNLLGTAVSRNYNGVLTAGRGLVAEYLSLDSLLNFANLPFQGPLTLSSIVGLFRVTFYVVVAQVATTSSTLPDIRFSWTDNDNSTLQTSPSFNSATPSANSLTTLYSGSIIVNGLAGSDISFQTGAVTPYASAGATPMKYSVHLRIEAI